MDNSQNLPKAVSVRNPKRDKDNRRGRSGWYDYYAGFSPNFVKDALACSTIRPPKARLLDPWNGSGTTTEIGARSGFNSAGFDLNPVMVIVAQARTLQSNISSSLGSILEEIILRAATMDHVVVCDSLHSWLSSKTAASLRRIECAIQAILVDDKPPTAVDSLPSFRNVSALAAFFYVALFRVLRVFLRPFRSSNPTWIKTANSPRDRIHVPDKQLLSLLRDHVAQMANDLQAESDWGTASVVPRVNIGLASSISLPIASRSIDIVVTSPPYCTRLDYVVKTAPELSLLGLGDERSLRRLRQEMIGTPTIAENTPIPCADWGRTCMRLLQKVAGHTSRASKSYYLKTHIQYFSGLHESLLEINRTLANSGQCFFVVQDSYYKEVHIDLARILEEMANKVGWKCNLRRDFSSSRSMVGVNRGARAYHDPKLSVESVLHFRKASPRG